LRQFLMLPSMFASIFSGYINWCFAWKLMSGSIYHLTHI
jgi:hypothetical protein